MHKGTISVHNNNEVCKHSDCLSSYREWYLLAKPSDFMIHSNVLYTHHPTNQYSISRVLIRKSPLIGTRLVEY